MSFYGSVYYQLIDAFHKIIANNNGKNKNKSSDFASSYSNGLAIQAEGRKGVINLDSGNAWIGFTKGADAEDPIKIWHSKPQTSSSANQAKGFMKIDSLPDGASATTLRENDLIESCSISYDNAGHAIFTPHYYYLPKADISNKVQAIEDTLGTSQGLSLPETDTKTIFGYISKNKTDIDTAESDINTIESNIGAWPYENFNKRGVAEIIGNYNIVLNTNKLPSTTSSNFKSLSDIIGNFKSIYDGDKFDTDKEKKPINISDAIIKLKTLIVELTTEMKDQDKYLATMIGTYDMPEGSNLYSLLQSAKNTLNDKIDTTKADLETNINDKESALTNRLDGHELRINAAESSIKLLTNGTGTEEIDSVNELIEYVKTHGPEVTGILNSINNVLPAQISTAIADYNTNTVQPLANLVGKESVSTQISTAITNYNTNTIKPLADLVGDTKVSDQISTAITNYDTNTIQPLVNLVGNEKVSDQILSAITNYDTNTVEPLAELVGNEKVSDQILSAITNYDTSTIKPLAELIGDKDVPSQIEEALTLYTENSVNPAIAQAFTNANLSQYATKGDLGQYTTKGELNITEGNIMAILGSREDDDTETVFQKLEKLDNYILKSELDDYILKSEIDTYIANSISGWQSDVDSQIEDLKKQLKELTGQTDDGSEGGSEGTESGENTGTEPGTNPEGPEPGGNTESTDPEGDIE